MGRHALVEPEVGNGHGHERHLRRVHLDGVAAVGRLDHGQFLAACGGRGGQAEQTRAVLLHREGEGPGLVGAEGHHRCGGVDAEGEVGGLRLLVRAEAGLDAVGVAAIGQCGEVSGLGVPGAAVEVGAGPAQLAGILRGQVLGEDRAVHALLLTEQFHTLPGLVQDLVLDVGGVAQDHQVGGHGVEVAVTVRGEPELAERLVQGDHTVAVAAHQLAAQTSLDEVLTGRQDDVLGVPVTGEAQVGDGQRGLTVGGGLEGCPTAHEALGPVGQREGHGRGTAGGDRHGVGVGTEGAAGHAHGGLGACIVGLGQHLLGAGHGEGRLGVPEVLQGHGEGRAPTDLAQGGCGLAVHGGDDVAVHSLVDLGEARTDLAGRVGHPVIVHRDHGGVHQQHCGEVHPLGAAELRGDLVEVLHHQGRQSGHVR